MAPWRPDPSFYPSPRLASEAPREKLAYVALLDANGGHDAIGVVDVDPTSSDYCRLVGRTEMPGVADELHHFGWNACSSHLCPWAPHAHVERRYLIVPGIRSSRIHVLDTRPDPRHPHVVKVIGRDELIRKTGYSAPHTVHCGPDGVFLSALGNAAGAGPGGIFVMDHDSLELKGAWEKDRGSQSLAYDFGLHLGFDTIVTSEWGTPGMIVGGLDLDLLLNGKYGNALHVWDTKTREHRQRLELGAQYQMTLALQPARDPSRAYGFAAVAVSLADLSASVWLWHLDGARGNERWKATKVIEIPAEPADPGRLPPLLSRFGAVPPLVTDLNLSLDDRSLFVSCWGTGELLQFDVSDPFRPVKTGSVRVGGIVGRAAHPARPEMALSGGPQMVEVSRDGRRVYVTNSLYSPWDDQFYPDGIEGWMAKCEIGRGGRMTLDPAFLIEFGAGVRPHQVRLEGGDASSDSFCFS